MSMSSPRKRKKVEKECASVAVVRIQDDVDRSKSKMLLNMAKLWRESSLCDIEIDVENQTFRAHRNILAAGSDYMNALLCENRFKDSNKERIHLDDITAGMFKLMLDWIYEGKCDVEKSELLNLLEAASRLQCVDLATKLEEAIIIKRLITSDICLAMWNAADRMHLTKLATAAKEEALKSYRELVDTEEFNALPASKLSTLLANDKLIVKNEEAVFESVVSWAKAQSPPPSSDDEFGEICENIRFPLMSKSFIDNHVMTEQLMIYSQRAIMALLRSMKDKAYNETTKQTLERNFFTWDDMKPGLRVRLKNNLVLVKTLCERPAPGATEECDWTEDMEAFIGSEETIKEVNNCRRSVSFNEPVGYEWPFDALERI